MDGLYRRPVQPKYSLCRKPRHIKFFGGSLSVDAHISSEPGTIILPNTSETLKSDLWLRLIQMVQFGFLRVKRLNTIGHARRADVRRNDGLIFTASKLHIKKTLISGDGADD